jgi:hypothetical protein
MTGLVVQELYNSPNGDHWTLCRNFAGQLVVSHRPNLASGGKASEIDVAVFLSQGRHGPEHQALTEVLAKLDHRTQGNEAQDGSFLQSAEKLSRALGQAVARCWSNLPQEIQHDLFEAAVTAEGEAIRQHLAVYLHDKHERTVDMAQARAMLEPDSLGG